MKMDELEAELNYKQDIIDGFEDKIQNNRHELRSKEAYYVQREAEF